jgi:hypothetical protein
VADAQAGNGVEVDDTRVVVLADDVWDSVAPPVERLKVQMKQPREQQDQV